MTFSAFRAGTEAGPHASSNDLEMCFYRVTAIGACDRGTGDS
jgi:hypothetical protein